MERINVIDLLTPNVVELFKFTPEQIKFVKSLLTTSYNAGVFDGLTEACEIATKNVERENHAMHKS